MRLFPRKGEAKQQWLPSESVVSGPGIRVGPVLTTPGRNLETWAAFGVRNGLSLVYNLWIGGSDPLSWNMLMIHCRGDLIFFSCSAELSLLLHYDFLFPSTPLLPQLIDEKQCLVVHFIGIKGLCSTYGNIG